MDGVSSTQAAAALAGIFLQIVQVTKHVIETMKGARTALVDLVTRAERIRLNLELLRSLTSKLSDPMEKNAALLFNESAYRRTADEVLALVCRIADTAKHHDLVMKVNWLFYRSDVAALVKKLEERESDLGLVLAFIAAQSSVVTESEVLSLRARVENRTKIIDTFSNVLSGDDTQIATDSGNSGEQPALSEEFRPRAGWSNLVTNLPQTAPSLWLGVLIREAFTPAYLQKRAELANASYFGDWKTVLEIIDEGKEIFNESWANAFRLNPRKDYLELSLWTPLHQAAYMRAPVSVISRLIEHGAFRTNIPFIVSRTMSLVLTSIVPLTLLYRPGTLPTGKTKGEFRFSDLTAIGIARELGYDEIYNILAPVVRHVLPAVTLTSLEAKFHKLLWAELKECGPLHPGSIRLPLLATLTELERPEMLFPLALFRKAFLFRLDGRELVVLSLGRRQSPSRQVFRVTTEGWTAIHDAIIIGQ